MYIHKCIYIYTHFYVCNTRLFVYSYVSGEKEREGERERDIYIYIYIYIGSRLKTRVVQGRAKERRGHETRKGWEQANCCCALGSHRPPGHPCDTTRPPRLRFCERPGGVRRSTVSVPCPFGTLTNLQLLAIGDPIGGLWHRSDSPGEHRGGRSSIRRERTWYFFGCTENGYSTDADGNRGGKLPLSKNHKWEAWGGPIPVHMWYVSFGAQPCVEVRRPWRPRYRGNNPWLFSSCTANIRGSSAPDKPIIQGKGCKLDVWDRVLELDDQCAPKYPVNALGSMHVFVSTLKPKRQLAR